MSWELYGKLEKLENWKPANFHLACEYVSHIASFTHNLISFL